MPEGNALDDFSQEFKQDPDFPIQDQKDPLDETTVPAKDDATITERDNREARRAKKALQAEREAAIILNERVRALSEKVSELERFKTDVGTPVDDDVYDVLYGNTPRTPETEKVAASLQKLLEKNAQKARDLALQEFEARSQEGSREFEEARNTVDSEFEALEDEFGVDFERNTKLRNDFVDFVDRLSRKDTEGNILEYPDFRSAFETFQSLSKRDTSRQREIASRGMTRGNNTSGQAADKEHQEYLKNLGIFFGN